ncbi:hypothetical protein BH09VER1_BH09VER1_09480 [soil metagenome]
MDPQPPSHRIWPTVVAAIVLLLFFGLCARLLLLAVPVADEDGGRREERLKAYADLQAENARKLGSYAWIDREKGIVQIPLDRAIAITLPELKARPPAPAGPIATPSPVSP